MLLNLILISGCTRISNGGYHYAETGTQIKARKQLYVLQAEPMRVAEYERKILFLISVKVLNQKVSKFVFY